MLKGVEVQIVHICFDDKDIGSYALSWNLTNAISLLRDAFRPGLCPSHSLLSEMLFRLRLLDAL